MFSTLYGSLISSLPFSKQKILNTSKLKEIRDDKFKFDENGRKLFNWVEKTEGKGEIAHYERFLLFPQCYRHHFLSSKKTWVMGLNDQIVSKNIYVP